METIIVTGGAGYIGSHTIIELLKNPSINIISIDNYCNSNAENYQRIEKITSKKIQYLDVDLCDKTRLFKTLNEVGNIQGIIHFAALKAVPESVSNPLLYYNNNLNSLLNLLAYCTEYNIENFIFSSSCSIYGNADQLPVTENTPIKKSESPYAHTKQIGEEMIQYVCRAYPHLNCVLLRYFNPVGAHMSGLIGELPIKPPNNLVPIITQTASGKNKLTVFGTDYNTRDGSCIRDYIHVSDIAAAHVNALFYLLDKKYSENISIFNLGTGNGVSVLEAIGSFEKVSGIKLNYTIGNRREGDVIAIYADNAKAINELQWKPKYNLDDMMLSAWKWQQNLNKEA
ncbi:MAG: UDP-glucose 4-epimerase GalE [Sphingobacteriaceae bacterium]|nr:UDP-glucose 4-epimerase GalE [Sphingobacteriaceae bacterium]